ncbi:MAG: hypothetical protein L0H79_15245 [Intrasporangium sp.]|uniref:hypothetical protein n=1 Tax=Intrasporangium sp. TaxID=1925024 RepID=UPI0026492635|nr:hypothetical protein [Intrasporangium sp.]MDN5797096.1 hypothetical protein [Intrasporangium sp.]
MRVLVLAPGTRGDAAPAAGLAAAFVADGHDVTLVAGADYAAYAIDAGCAHVAITASMTPPGVHDGTENDERSGAPGVRAYLASLREYMDAAASTALSAVGSSPDVVLTNAISPYGHDIAEHLGVPSAAALLQPAEPSSAYPPMIAATRDLYPISNRLAGALAERVRTPYDPACARVRAELGLLPEPRSTAQRRRRRAGLPVHHGISTAVLPRPADWSDRLTLDGFWCPPPRPGWGPSAELTPSSTPGPRPSS